MKNTRLFSLFFLLFCFSCWNSDSMAQSNRLRLSGFSEIGLSSRFGAPASMEAHELFEEYGHAADLAESGIRLSYPGIALNMLGELNEKLYFQGEISFTIHHSAPTLEFNRLYLDYRINEKFNLIAGQFLTPIGYLNMNQRIYGYLNYSLKPRDMVNEEYGFIPVTTLGLQAYGRFSYDSWGLNYRLAYGTGRGLTPHHRPFTATIGHEENSAPGVTGSLEALIPTAGYELKIGMSAYHNPRLASVYIEELGGLAEFDDHGHGHEEEHTGEDPALPEGEEVEEEHHELRMQETIFAPYIMFDHNKFQVFAEYHGSRQQDTEGELPQQSYSYHALSTQFLYKTQLSGKPFYPYIRYDFALTPNQDGGPYYGLVQEGESLLRTYVPNTAELMIGMAWDVLPFNRLKLEYSRYLDGPFLTSGINASTSFAF